MKKFGIGKKGDGDEDSLRKGLFGARSRDKSPAPPTNNPYAQPSAPLDPYTRAKMNAGVGPPPQNYGPPSASSSRSNIGLPSNPKHGGFGQAPPSSTSVNNQDFKADLKSPGMQNGHGAAPTSGYGAEKYGDQGGYGADRYGGGNPYGGAPTSNNGSRYGAGGYGGLGKTISNETTTTDTNRDALFQGAQERAQKRQANPYGGDPPAYDDHNGADDGGNGEGYGGSSETPSYGAYQDRQLTAEEEEEEDVTATKQEIKFTKQQDVSSTRNALRIAAQAEETGRNTLARLGAQGESIHNTEKNLDIAANHNRLAEAKARELKTLNRSMFAVHVNSPFNGADRRKRRDEDIINKHHDEREQRELTRQKAFQSGQRMQEKFADIEKRSMSGGGNKTNLAERAKYQFEADSDDEEMENEIDGNLNLLGGAANRLHALAIATGEEVEVQNRLLGDIGKKSDSVDDQLRLNSARLGRIK